MPENDPNKPIKKPSTSGIVQKSREIAGSLENESKAIEEALDSLSKSSQKDIVESMDMFRDILKDIDREAQKNNVNFNNIQKTLSKIKQEAIRLKETTENTDLYDVRITDSLETIINKFKNFEKQVKQVKTRTENYNKILQQSTTSILTTANSMETIISAMSDLEFNNRGVAKSFRDLLNELDDFESSPKLRKLITVQGNTVDAVKAMLDTIELDPNKIENQLNQNEKLLKSFKDELKKQTETGAPKEVIDKFQELIDNLQGADSALEKYNEKIKSIPSLQKATKIAEFTKDIPVLGDAISKAVGYFQEGIREGLKGNLEGQALLAKGLEKLGNIAIVAIISSIVKQAFELNTQITSLQKGFGLSSFAAQDLRAEITTAANQAGSMFGDMFITSEKLLASFTALSGELGFQVTTSGRLLETFTNLEKRFGLGATEATNLTSILGLTNKNSEKVLSNTIKTINRSRDSNKLFNNTKVIIKDIASASASTVVSLGRSPDLLAKAAVKARELGISLDQVEKIADSLLNFESSIEAELKAELVTGKQLNLERARFLALNNDLVGLQEELNKQNINFTEYTQMSRIGQQALAEALGMGREEMSKMLFNQEKQALAQKEARGELEGQTYEMFKALDTSEKFGLAMGKVKDAFSNIVITLSPIIDALGIVVEAATLILQPFITLSNAITFINKEWGIFGKALTGVLATYGLYYVMSRKILAVQKAIALATALSNPARAAWGLVAAGVIAASYAYNKSVEERAMGGPVSSGSPYLVGEEGPELFVPGSSGQIVNNTDLGKMSSPSINLQPLVERLDKLEKTLVEYRSVPVVIENRLDGDALLRNTLRGNRRGNPAIVVPSVYTGGLA